MALRVSTCMIIRENKILLMNRNKEPYMGWWAFPGGKVEQGESTLNAVVREISEEIGLDISPSLYCNLFEDLTDSGKIIDQFDLYYHISMLDSFQVNPNAEGEFRWFELHDVPEDMVPSDKKILEIYLIDSTPIKAMCELKRLQISTDAKKNFEYILGSWSHSIID